MLNSRKFSFVVVTASKGGEGKTVVESDAEVTYSGKRVTVKL
jgi:Mrp family chromosome partitioning ATPase